MLDIPIFYGDYQRKEELKLTCGQFISLIEQHGTNQRDILTLSQKNALIYFRKFSLLNFLLLK